MTQQLMALRAANAKRGSVNRLKMAVRCGEFTLGELLEARPAELADWPLVDVVRLFPGFGSGSRRRAEGLTRLGRRAAFDRVNLLVSLDRASSATTGWLVRHADPSATVAGEGGGDRFAALVGAVREHRETITGASPPERWATADERLWAACERIVSGR